jgi:hypothetical protein
MSVRIGFVSEKSEPTSMNADAPKGRTGRELEFKAAHVIGLAAESIDDLVITVVRRDQIAVGIIRVAQDARADTANVETAQLRPEEAIGQANRVLPWSRR